MCFPVALQAEELRQSGCKSFSDLIFNLVPEFCIISGEKTGNLVNARGIGVDLHDNPDHPKLPFVGLTRPG